MSVTPREGTSVLGKSENLGGSTARVPALHLDPKWEGRIGNEWSARPLLPSILTAGRVRGSYFGGRGPGLFLVMTKLLRRPNYLNLGTRLRVTGGVGHNGWQRPSPVAGGAPVWVLCKAKLADFKPLRLLSGLWCGGGGKLGRGFLRGPQPLEEFAPFFGH